MPYHEEFKEVLLGPPHCNIGKKGVDDQGIIDHVKKLLKRNKIIKVKVLKSYLGIKDKSERMQKIADELAILTNSHVQDIRGSTFILSQHPIDKKNNK